jgi:hypothetical protein
MQIICRFFAYDAEQESETQLLECIAGDASAAPLGSYDEEALCADVLECIEARFPVSGIVRANS